MDQALLACPFCGSFAIGMRTRKTTIVECDNCGALFIKRSQQEAIDAWNTRYFQASDPQKPYGDKASSEDSECE